MPVDPGNLLLIGRAGGVPVLGAPGCARSPVENGFDWVLMRLLAGLEVTRAELMGMGVGGLLMEIVTRPQPRTAPSSKPTATSRSSCWRRDARRGWAVPTSCWRNSTARSWCGSPPSRRSPRRPLTSSSSPAIRPIWSSRRSPALRWIRPQSGFCDGACVFGQGRRRGGAGRGGRRGGVSRRHAADASAMIDRLIEAFAADRGHLIAVPVTDGRRGNPVLWSRRFFRN